MVWPPESNGIHAQVLKHGFQSIARRHGNKAIGAVRVNCSVNKSFLCAGLGSLFLGFGLLFQALGLLLAGQELLVHVLDLKIWSGSHT